MQKLQTEQHHLAQPLFSGLAEFNLSVASVLAGTIPGEVYLDDANTPRVGLTVTPEGHYLAGDSAHEASYAALKELIPLGAYLIFQLEGWQNVLNQIWSNPSVRRHPRQHYLRRSEQVPAFHHNVPPGFELAQVDRSLLARTSLTNYDELKDWAGTWSSPDDFFEHGVGFCLIKDNRIASRCIADCVVGDQAEIGISTAPAYRRQGLAAIVASATVAQALERGIKTIGWHCLSSNAGSIAVATKLGFAKERDYSAFSPTLPTENAADMTPTEYADWATHYERFLEMDASVYRAAASWAMAGDTDRSRIHLQTLIDRNWQRAPAFLEENWMFDAVRTTSEYAVLLAALHQHAQENSAS